MTTVISYRQQLRKLDLDNNKYHCDKCNLSYRDIYELNRHYKSKKHTKKYKRYPCPFEDCDYKSNGNYHLQKHLESRKHKN